MSLNVPRDRALPVVRTLIKERDEARAQLANAAASEVDAVQGRQECEAELREVRARLRLLAECFLNSEPIAGEMTFDQRREALYLAQSIVEEDGND